MHPVIQKFMLLFEKSSNMARIPKAFDTDVDIYRGEIHIIQLIGDREQLYISEIAKLIGVTKGTISQIVKRLEGKGLVVKQTDIANNTRQQVGLTAKGLAAYRAHERFHQLQNVHMIEFLDSLDREQLEVVSRFLNLADEMIEGHL